MSKKIWFVTLVLALSGAEIASAQSVNHTPIKTSKSSQISINALDTYLRDTKDLQGEFVQIVLNKQGQERSSGQVWISKPGKFYWDYQEPDKQKIISDGKKVWQYDIDLEQISVRNTNDLVGDIAMRILTGKENLEKQFVVTTVAKENIPMTMTDVAKNGTVFLLLPKQKQDGYDSVYVIMENDTLKALVVDGGRGQQTFIGFLRLKRNIGIPTSKFDFTPPKGIDVVGD